LIFLIDFIFNLI